MRMTRRLHLLGPSALLTLTVALTACGGEEAAPTSTSAGAATTATRAAATVISTTGAGVATTITGATMAATGGSAVAATRPATTGSVTAGATTAASPAVAGSVVATTRPATTGSAAAGTPAASPAITPAVATAGATTAATTVAVATTSGTVTSGAVTGGTAASPAASPATSGSAVAAGAARYTLMMGSEATYTVNEKFANLPAPNDAVGKTDQVTGQIVLGPNGQPVEGGRIVVNVQSLKSDQDRRDNYIRMNSLQSSMFPEAVFVIRSAEGLPATLGAMPTNFRILGDLTLRGVTKPVTWTATATQSGDTLNGTATLTVRMQDFEIMPPMVAILTTSDMAKLDLKIVARRMA